MKLMVNGEQRELGEGRTVRDLLEQLGMGETPVAVELNKQVVPRRRHDQTPLRNGDVLELVTLVGGG